VRRSVARRGSPKRWPELPMNIVMRNCWPMPAQRAAAESQTAGAAQRQHHAGKVIRAGNSIRRPASAASCGPDMERPDFPVAKPRCPQPGTAASARRIAEAAPPRILRRRFCRGSRADEPQNSSCPPRFEHELHDAEQNPAIGAIHKVVLRQLKQNHRLGLTAVRTIITSNAAKRATPI